VGCWEFGWELRSILVYRGALSEDCFMNFLGNVLL